MGILGILLGLLLKTGLLLIGNVLKQLAKSILITELTASVSEINKMVGSGIITLVISNKEMNVIMKKIKSLKESGLLIKGVSETIKNETKEKKEDLSECY